MRYQSFITTPRLLDGVVAFWTEDKTWSLFSVTKLSKDKLLVILEITK